METVLLGSFLLQYDSIKTISKEMKPFLNINEETSCFYHRSVFTLKILFVVYAFYSTFLKHFSLIFKRAGNFSRTPNNGVFREIFHFLSAFVIFLLYSFKGHLTLISSEFLADIFLLIISLNYAFEAYQKEIQKIISVIFMCLFVQWAVNHATNTEQFRLCTYFQVLALLILSYLPMMPNNPKYRHRLTYLYIVMYIWIFYKLNHHYDRHHYVMDQNKIGGPIRQDRYTELEPERGKFDDTLQHLDINNENICPHTENIRSSLYTAIHRYTRYTPQNAVPIKAEFPSSQEQNITEKLERVSKPTNFSKGTQNEDRNTTKSDILDAKEVKKDDINSDHRTGTLKVHIEQIQSSFSPKSSVVENEQKTAGTMFKLPKTVYVDGESLLHGDEIYENTLVTENKRTVQSEETHFEEVQSGLVSIGDASEEENDATGAGNKVTEADEVADSDIKVIEAGKVAYGKYETSKSNDANFKPEGKKYFNVKITKPVFKRYGEMDKTAASKVKSNGIGSKVENNHTDIQKFILKNKSLVKTGSSIQDRAGKTLKNIDPMVNVRQIRTGHNDRTEIQIKKSGTSEITSLITNQPKKLGIIKLKQNKLFKPVKKLLPIRLSESVAKGHHKFMKKDFLAIDNDGSGSESKATE